MMSCDIKGMSEVLKPGYLIARTQTPIARARYERSTSDWTQEAYDAHFRAIEGHILRYWLVTEGPTTSWVAITTYSYTFTKIHSSSSMEIHFTGAIQDQVV